MRAAGAARSGDLLAEELRRLDADEPYAEALEVATGVSGLAGRLAGAASTSGSTRPRPTATATEAGGGGAPRQPREAAAERPPTDGGRLVTAADEPPTPDVVVEPDADVLAAHRRRPRW